MEEAEEQVLRKRDFKYAGAKYMMMAGHWLQGPKRSAAWVALGSQCFKLSQPQLYQG